MKILTTDIETSPHLAYSFQTWNTNISPVQIVKPTRMTCWAAKWLDGRTYFMSEYHQDPETMVAGIHKLLDEADVVVTYNGDKFDHLHMNREFHKIGLHPPSPFVSVDLYKVIKRREIWASHKLAYITEQFHLSGKMTNDGWKLWLAVEGVFGEEAQKKAWNQMRRYNRQDVVTTEELFIEYRPYVTNLPNAALYADEKVDVPFCPNCLGLHVTRQGFRRSKTRRYPQYQCQTCGKWFSETRSDGSAGTA